LTDYAEATAAGLLVVLEFFTALTCFSLREFSFSRLEEICRSHSREARFGVILKRHDQALLLLDFVSIATTVALVAVLFDWLGISWPASDSAVSVLLLFVVKVAAFLVGLGTLAVLLPWITAHVVGERYLYHAWPLIALLMTVCRPMLRMAVVTDRLTHRMMGRRTPAEDDGTTLTEEIRSVIDEGQREGLLESEARSMIHRVIELQEEDTAAVMTPRTDMFHISVDCTLEEAREQLLEAGHSRVPVVGETTDDIVGILYAKDLLRHIHTGADGSHATLKDIVRTPFYVPETTGIDHLLESMRKRHVHVAIVVDEYGGVAGLVTMEDILEEIVGEIVDEYDADEEEGVRVVSPGVTEVEARVHIDDLNERFQFGLPEDSDYDTLGGFVFTQLGHVPRVGENFTWKQLRFSVLQASDRKVESLRIEVDKTLIDTTADES